MSPITSIIPTCINLSLTQWNLWSTAEEGDSWSKNQRISTTGSPWIPSLSSLSHFRKLWQPHNGLLPNSTATRTGEQPNQTISVPPPRTPPPLRSNVTGALHVSCEEGVVLLLQTFLRRAPRRRLEDARWERNMQAVRRGHGAVGFAWWRRQLEVTLFCLWCDLGDTWLVLPWEGDATYRVRLMVAHLSLMKLEIKGMIRREAVMHSLPSLKPVNLLVVWAS